MNFTPLSQSTQRKIGIATLAIVALCVIASLIAFFAGSVFFENPLPKNYLEYEGWLNLLFGACGIYLGWLGLKQGLKQFFEEDVVEVTYDKNGKVINEDHGQGFIYQVIMMLVFPIAGYCIGTIGSYYICRVILGVISFLIPYLMVAAMVAGSIWYIFKVYRATPTAPAVDDTADDADDSNVSEFMKKVCKFTDSILDFATLYTMELKSLALALISILFAVMIVTDGFGISFSRNDEQNQNQGYQMEQNDILEVDSQEDPFVIKNNNIANIRLGESFADLHKEYADFYSKVTSTPLEENEDGDVRCRYSLWKDKDLVATIDYNSTQQYTEQYTVYSSRIFVSNGINPTMNLRAALGQPGVSAKAIYRNGGYTIKVTANDYQIMSPSKAAESLVDKAKVKISLLSEFNPTLDLTAEDFDRQAQVEYILVR